MVPTANRCKVCDCYNPTEYSDCQDCGAKLTRIQIPRKDELKICTILFADIKGFTAMSESMEPEQVMAVISKCFMLLTDEINRYHGYVDKYIGDAIMALFGAPIAREDDPLNAVRAARAMQKVLNQFTTHLEKSGWQPLKMRIGINTGQVITGIINPNRPDSYTVMGDSVNLAARLEQACPIGQILISRNTFRQTADLFDFTPLPAIKVKGKKYPIDIYQVNGETIGDRLVKSRLFEGIAKKIVGRDREIEKLEQILSLVEDQKRLKLAVISGPPGIGKTALRQEFGERQIRQGKRYNVLFGRCSQQEAGTPYSNFKDMFQYYFDLLSTTGSEQESREKITTQVKELFRPKETGELEQEEQGEKTTLDWQEEAEATAHFLGFLLGVKFPQSKHIPLEPVDPLYIKNRIFKAVTDFLLHISRRETVIIYLEDIQWSSNESLELLGHIRENLSESPLYIINLSRDELFGRKPEWEKEDEENGFFRICLDSMTSDSCRQLVNHLLQKMDQGVNDSLMDLILQRSDGNPLFVEEIIKMMLDKKVIIKKEQFWHLNVDKFKRVEIPETIQKLFQARLDHLDPREKEFLLKSSIVGKVFWQSLIHSLYEDGFTDELTEAIKNLQDRGYISQKKNSSIKGEIEFVFVNNNFMETCYQTLPKRKSRPLHLLVAHWLDEQVNSGAFQNIYSLAEHYSVGGNLDRAFIYFASAGMDFKNLYANHRAKECFHRALALEAVDDPLLQGTKVGEQIVATNTQRINVFINLADLQILTGNLEAALENILKAKEIHRQEYSQEKGQNSADEQMDPKQVEEYATILLHMHNWYSKNNDYLKAKEISQQAINLLQKISPGITLLRFYNLAIMNYSESGQVQEALDYAKQAQELIGRLGDKTDSLEYQCEFYHYISWVLTRMGRFEESQGQVNRCLKLAKRINNEYHQARAYSSKGASHYYLGQVDQALNSWGEAASLYRKMGYMNLLFQTEYSMGELYFACSQYDQSMDYLDGAEKYFLDKRYTTNISDIYRLKGENYLGLNQVDKAELYASKALDTVGETINHQGHANRAMGRVMTAKCSQTIDAGQEERAEQYLLKAIQLFKKANQVGEMGIAYRDYALFLREIKKDNSGYEKYFLRAKEIFTRLNMSLEIKKMAELIGEGKAR